ncbi:Tyrosine-protein phosphatase [Colletotrichum higginsianum]|uniref:Tyrosine-protein phosphatase n=1 Tax=Colletotrichum higginsianum TaxID=80884 RepID=A0A4T0VHP4_9PEZI|nr:Tyrosine-protein phosphatase [Colletotrichum higginsianum]
MREHFRDRPGESFLFHCTAGRDLTGMLASLLQGLAGTDPKDVRSDYMLSRLDAEPERERLLSHARIEAGVNLDHPGFYKMRSMRASCWNVFITGVQEDRGGWEGYVTKALGFSNEGLVSIKGNLRVNKIEY